MPKYGILVINLKNSEEQTANERMRKELNNIKQLKIGDIENVKELALNCFLITEKKDGSNLNEVKNRLDNLSPPIKYQILDLQLDNEPNFYPYN